MSAFIDNNLAWCVLLAPFVAAVLIMMFTRRSRGLSSFLSCLAVLASFAGACVLFSRKETAAAALNWIEVPGLFAVPLGLVLDNLSRTMLIVVTGIGSLIHIYSLGYMRDDEGKSRSSPRFLSSCLPCSGSYLSNNFLMMFSFWELVGFTSYLLIGHWFERDAAAEAAKKAFLTNRIGDFGFMLGILMIWATTGSVVFADIAPRLSILTAHPAFLTTAALLIFCGAAGKSAQFPLHVWLPDAMEGPTPVSALIHAATMVAAGVYMLVRVGFLIQASQAALDVIAWIGTITAVMAALIATQQNDIKRILAYSTLSQLGYMVMAFGLSSGDAAMFHLFTHAFFKALLFLGAGSVIVALHHEQDIWEMGGLSKNLTITFVTFLVGALALMGCPPFSGFFSKDAILVLAYEHNTSIFILALGTAFLTAFYVTRLLVVVFLGHPRGHAARVCKESPLVMTGPLIILALLVILGGSEFFAGLFVSVPHEGSMFDKVPMLAIAALVFGVASAFAIYRSRATEAFDVDLLRRKFYFDELYAWLIDKTQGLLARLSAFFDRWFIDTAGVGGVSGGTWGIGALLRFVQVGNLQAYSFLFGLGIVALIYFAVFH